MANTRIVARPTGVIPSIRAPTRLEVLLPPIAPRVKQRDQLTGRRIDTRQIRSLSKVTAVAGQGQIVQVIRSAMLFGDDVFDVVGEFAVRLPEQTILASAARPGAGRAPVWRRPLLLLLKAGIQMPAGFELDDGNKVGGVDQGLILSPLILGEGSFIGTLREIVNPFLDGGGQAQLHDAPS